MITHEYELKIVKTIRIRTKNKMSIADFRTAELDLHHRSYTDVGIETMKYIGPIETEEKGEIKW